MDGPCAAALAAAFRAFDSDDTARVAVLCGANDTFCAGADLKAVASGDRVNRTEPDGDGPMGPSRLQLTKPVRSTVAYEYTLQWFDRRTLCRTTHINDLHNHVAVVMRGGGAWDRFRAP